jgi:DNA-binding transcriptional ArsR family regulator
MSEKIKTSVNIDQTLLNIDGQIILLLAEGSRTAGDIYKNVGSSQSTVSRKLARLVDLNILDCKISSIDRRTFIYSINHDYRDELGRSRLMRALINSSATK